MDEQNISSNLWELILQLSLSYPRFLQIDQNSSYFTEGGVFSKIYSKGDFFLLKSEEVFVGMNIPNKVNSYSPERR